MQEQEMIALLQKHDERGMDELFKHYRPLMRYVIAPILPNQQDQEDCLSEAAMRIWEKIGLYDRERGSWSAWLTALARNAALNHARRRRLDAGGALVCESAPLESGPEEIVLRREREEAVKRALGQFSQGERTLFYRKYYYLQTTAQIAAELGTTRRAVEGKLYRLKKRLRKVLGGEEHAC